MKEKYYTVLKTKDINPFLTRDIRQNILDRIKKNIEKNGYLDSRVLVVVEKDGKYFVSDGNHRLNVVNELGIEEVPCIVYPDGDLYKLAIQGNIAEGTFAPLDLFDWLSFIQKLKDESLNHKEIGKKIGWSESSVDNYSSLIKNILRPVLDFTKKYQKGRMSKKLSSLSFNFTEGWFSKSGLYNLNQKYQMEFMKRFVDEKCGWSKSKVLTETKKYNQWQDFIEIAKNELFDQDDLEILTELIENNSFKTEAQLRNKINELNKEAKNKLICGDAIIELEELEDSSINVVITDMPYGVEYVSHRSKFKEHITKEGIIHDTLEEVIKLLDKSCEILNRKTKSDSHFYIFCNWQVYPDFKEIIEKYFEIRNVIVWDKCNKGAGDLIYNWGFQHEMIIFATKGKRPINKRLGNVISIPKVDSSKMIHPVQKPVDLIKKLLEVSGQPADTICDPFMGSGSTIKAVIEVGNMNYIGIELDNKIFESAKSFIGKD